MKKETCAEVIQQMRSEVEGYPVLLKKSGSSKEIMAITNDEGNWDLFIYKSHGYIFTRVAKNIKSETLAKLEKELSN